MKSHKGLCSLESTISVNICLDGRLQLTFYLKSRQKPL